MSPVEPNGPGGRQITMKRLFPTLVLGASLAMGMSACGDQQAAGSDATATPASPRATADRVGACAPDDPAITDARILARLDLDGDGRAEELRATSREPCPGIAFAETADGMVGGRLGELSGEVQVLTLPGSDSQLFATRASHPRGGFQVRVFGADGPEIGEVTAGGAPVVPFVATDTTQPGVSVQCRSDGLVLTTAAPRDGRGSMTYRVTRQSFTVTGHTASPGERRTAAEGLAEAAVRKRFPGLYDARVFSGC